jgi:hypothetical protein
MESNHQRFQSKIALGGAGNRTQIETDLYDIPLQEMPQRHVLPLHHTTSSKEKQTMFDLFLHKKLLFH